MSDRAAGHVFRIPIALRWSDLDAFNHVNNAEYLRYLEEARVQWLAAIPGMSLDDRIAPVLVASHVNYRRPLTWPHDVMVELYVDRLASSSVTIGHRIVDQVDADVLYSDGSVVVVWMDTQTGKSAPLPEAVRAASS